MKFDIKNLSDNKAQLYFYGDICSSELDAWTYDDQFPTSVRDFLKDYEGKDIEIHVNSGGGSCFAGICIAEMIKQHKGKTVAYVDGLSASIATLICCACDEVHITPNSYWMVHFSWCGVQGNKNDLQETINLLEKMDNTIADAYMKHLKEGVTREQIVDMMKAETWLCGNEILDYFNFILEDEKQVAYAKIDLNNYKNIPSELLNELEDEDKEDEDEKQVCEKCGKEECECEEVVEEEQVEEEEQLEEVVEEEQVEEEEQLEDEVEEVQEVQEDEEEVCPDCQKNPCECEEIKKQQEEQRKIAQIAQAKKELDFLEARAFLKKYL